MSKLETRRFDAKLDSFLRRRLTQEDYERISTSEPCVILSPEDKRVHRHAVLGHQFVYLTEVPPKNLKIALHLKDVASIRLLDDLPDFLSGSEQENTVHVQINYKRLCKEKKFLKSLGERSPSILKKLGKGEADQIQQQKSPHSTSPLTTFQISASPEDGVISSRHGSTLSLSSASPNYAISTTVRSHSSLSCYSPAVGKRSPQLVGGESSQEERSRSLSPIATEDLYSYRKSPLPKHRTPPSVTLTPAHHGPTDSTSQIGFVGHHKQKVLMNGHSQHNHLLGTQGAQTSFKSHSAIQRRATELNSREMAQLGHRNSSTISPSSAHLAGSHSTINHSPSSSPELVESRGQTSEQLKRKKKHKSALTEHQFSSSPSFFSGSDDNLLARHSDRNSLMKLSVKHDSSLSLTNVASLSQSTGALAVAGARGEDCKHEAAIMDLYILKQSSDFYHQLCVAWMNVKINEVYSQDEEESPTLPKSFKQPHDHFSQKFCTLKQELLTTATSKLEASARLAQELCTACEKYFIIKRLFWEDSELFEFCLTQLKCHLLPEKTKGAMAAANRGDQLEYSLILMDLFYQMMRETHLFGKKFVILTRNSGQLLLSLATTVVHCVPPPMSNDSEFADLDSELTENSCAVLYELIQVTQQARWPLARKTNVSPTWLVEALAADAAIKTFCARMVSYASHVISRGTTATASSLAVDMGPGLGAELDPRAQVTLYHLAMVMNTVVQNSSSLVQLLRTHFSEEFRYFIRVSKAQKKLPPCSLSRDTLELLRMIKSKVLS